MSDVAFFIDLYIGAKRIFYDLPYIRNPKNGSRDYNDLKEVSEMVDEIGGEYSDFINVQVNAFRLIGVFPSPQHLLSKKAIDRYKLHQKMKNKYFTALWNTDGDILTIKSTGLSYSIKAIKSPIHLDENANYIINLAKKGSDLLGFSKEELKRVWENAEYTIIKLMYSGKYAPNYLLDFKTYVKGKLYDDKNQE